MKFWSDRKTDEEYVEQMRKRFKRKWPPARVFLLLIGLVGCGSTVFLGHTMFQDGASLIWADGDSSQCLKFVVPFAIGLLLGCIYMSAIVSLVLGVFWPYPSRNFHLMLKYHDALVAHGVSPEEQDE